MDTAGKLTIAGVALAFGVASACSLVVSTAGLSGGSSETDGSAVGDGGGDAMASLDAGDARVDVDASICPSTRGPSMVLVGVDGGPSFCIDSTEVTNAQYTDFLSASPTNALAPPPCQAKTSFVPSNDWPPSSAKANHPVVWVEWCDAAAFCKWAGKRLCGKIGGGPDDPTKHDDPTSNQQYFACSHAGEHAYPYGDTYDPKACNGTEKGTNGTAPVGSNPGCQGGFPGVFDLVGNACEWQDACASEDPAALCLDGPGSFVYPPDAGRSGTNCHFNDVTHRNDHTNNIGFRCCGQ